MTTARLRIGSRFPYAFLLGGILLLAVLMLPAGRAAAQSGHHTGRHKPKPRVIPAPQEDHVVQVEPSVWNISLALGNRLGGDLFRLEVVNGAVVPWVGLDPGGFQTSRFTADFEGSASWQAALSRELGAVWRLRAEVGHVSQDVTATALVGQTGAQFRYDRLGIWSLGVGIERDLVDLPSAPYMGVTGVISHWDPTVNDDLARTVWGGRISLGYRKMVGRRTSLFLETQLEGTVVDEGDFTPRAKPPFDPEAEVDFNEFVTFFAIRGGLRVSI